MKVDIHTPSGENSPSLNGRNVFNAYKPMNAMPVRIVDSDDELLDSMGKAFAKDERYERLNQWQKDLLQKKNAAMLSSDDIAEHCGIARSVVNTTIYTSRASPRSDITAAVNFLYNESLKPEEQEIRKLLTSSITEVFHVWGLALGFEIPKPGDDKSKIRFYKELSGVLMLNPLTIQRWAESVQKPTYSKLRKYHRLVTTLGKVMKDKKAS